MTATDVSIWGSLLAMQPPTDIALQTSAEHAYDLYLAKKKQISELQYECELLMDKYHSEMCKASIPSFLDHRNLEILFGEDESKKDFARSIFLRAAFSEKFKEKHSIDFVGLTWRGYSRTAVIIVLGIGDYEYSMECPIPQHIVRDEDKVRLVGNVKFRVDRIHKSQKDCFVKTMESVQMPTYDWKECFKAIEAIVEKEGSKNVREDDEGEEGER